MSIEQKPLVSIIMNCYNGEEFLNEALESIFSQTYPRFEVIFWDNRSIDNSAIIFKSKKDKRFKYFLAPKHTSLGEARNQAINKSMGELIAFLDCDDLWLPSKLEDQIPLFQKTTVGIVICDTYYFNKKRVIKQLYKKKPPPTGKVFSELLTNYFISLETAMIRKDALKDLDEWFDSRFEVIEEFDLFVRISFYWELEYVDKVLAKWRVHKKSLTWQQPELFPFETDLFIGKIINHHPKIEIDYQNELNILKANNSLDQALIYWAKKDKKSAFKLIKKYLLKNKRVTLVYLFIKIFGYKLFSSFMNLRRGINGL